MPCTHTVMASSPNKYLREMIFMTTFWGNRFHLVTIASLCICFLNRNLNSSLVSVERGSQLVNETVHKYGSFGDFLVFCLFVLLFNFVSFFKRRILSTLPDKINRVSQSNRLGIRSNVE